MKKVFKWFLTVFGVLFVCLLGLFVYFGIVSMNVKLDNNKLIILDRTVTYYDVYGNVFAEEVNGKSVCEIEKIPNHTKNAFIAIEDKRFYSHNGVDFKGLTRAFFNNVKSMSFKQGASTISQQLIKNTHLSGEKTFKRKIVEMSLAKKLEKQFSKDEILEMYLNTIYFGNNCYGIKNATKYYFDKDVADLDINESAMLAGIIKAPSNYCPFNNNIKCEKRKNVVLKQMYEQGYISKLEYSENESKNLVFSSQNSYGGYGYLYMARKELNSKLTSAYYGVGDIKVFTAFDPKKQRVLENSFSNFTEQNSDNSSVLMDKQGNICAYYSTCLEPVRQLGSVLKPIMVYAPAIENDVVYSMTKILDEKTNFNGYSPKNYNDKYYGYVSVKESLAKSLNVCAVKLLNSVGVDKAKSYVNKTDIKLSESDNSLCLALGSTKNGATLTQITSAYTVFNNNGDYFSPSCILKVSDNNGHILYSKRQKSVKIFSDDTVGIVNDMLSNCVNEGTAKKLSFTGQNLYAKTGTVGFENGNTDAYTISFNSEYLLGCWYGAKNNGFMSNSITGGSTPSTYSATVWNELYNGLPLPNPIELSGVKSEYIDKISYEQENKIILADENAPLRYKIGALFKESSVPTERSNCFSCPDFKYAKISANNNEIVLQLCVAEYVDFKIFRDDGINKILVYDSKNKSKTEFVDNSVLPNLTYKYSIVPYCSFENFVSVGKEVKLNEVKIDEGNFNDWWKEDLK